MYAEVDRRGAARSAGPGETVRVWKCALRLREGRDCNGGVSPRSSRSFPPRHERRRRQADEHFWRGPGCSFAFLTQASRCKVDARRVVSGVPPVLGCRPLPARSEERELRPVPPAGALVLVGRRSHDAPLSACATPRSRSPIRSPSGPRGVVSRRPRREALPTGAEAPTVHGGFGGHELDATAAEAKGRARRGLRARCPWLREICFHRALR